VSDPGVETINNALTIVRRMLVTARKRGLIATVPEIDWLKVPPQEFDFLDFEEADRLLAAVDAEWRTMVLVALRTGMRMGELIALRWQDVDLLAGKITVADGLHDRDLVGDGVRIRDRHGQLGRRHQVRGFDREPGRRCMRRGQVKGDAQRDRSGRTVTSSPSGLNVSSGNTGSACFTNNNRVELQASRSVTWSGVTCDGGNTQTRCRFNLGTAPVSVTATLR
jgi:hypothetical protein